MTSAGDYLTSPLGDVITIPPPSRPPGGQRSFSGVIAAIASVVAVLAVGALPVVASVSAGHSRPPALKHRLTQPLLRTPAIMTVNVSPRSVSNPATRSAAIGNILSELHRQLAARHLSGSAVGFLLIFASGPVSGISQAAGSARIVLNDLRERDHAFQRAAGAGYWEDAPAGFKFELFFFAA